MPVVDVETLLDDDHLLRRIHPSQIIQDKNRGGMRPSSGAFTDDEMSVDSSRLLQKYGLDRTFCLQKHSGYALVQFSAGFARSVGMTVLHTPQEDNPAHADVIGKKPKSIQRRFATEATIVSSA